MLSKILRDASSSAAPHWNWPRASGPASSAVGASGKGEAETQASQDARRIAELEKQTERRAQESRDTGYREGEAAGRAQAAAAIQPVIERLARSIDEIGRLRPQVLAEATSDLVHLSISIARRILHRELAIDACALDNMIAGAIQKLQGQNLRCVRVHPELETGVRQALGKQGSAGLSLIADRTLERGAVILETERGKLDASLETQLAEIGRGLADRISER